MTSKTKVLLVALDAADEGIIRDWAARGRLPVFQQLLESGIWGTTLGPKGHFASVWPSLMTSVTPARHARYAPWQIRPGTYETYPFRPGDLKREPFWNALCAAGRRVAVIDVPHSMLNSDMRGVQVVNWMTHDVSHGFCTFPAPLADEIEQRFGLDPVDVCDHLTIRSTEQVRNFRDNLVERVRRKTALATRLLDRDEWDLFLTVFSEAHCVGHQCWSVHDSGHPRHDADVARAVGDPIEDVYRALDHAVGELVQAAGSEATVVVCATHGMGPDYNGDHLLQDILVALGYIPAPSPAPLPRRLLLKAWKRLTPAMRHRLRPLGRRRWGILPSAPADWIVPRLDERNTCWIVPNGEVYGAIRVNLAGREPKGRIQPGSELDDFCQRVRRDLCALVNADTGAAAVRDVLRTADFESGPYLVELPDLLIEWNTDTPLSAVHSEKTGTIRRVFAGARSGHHRREGLFVMRGPSVRPRHVAEAVSIMDVAPTVASLLGVTLPDVEGKVIRL